MRAHPALSVAWCGHDKRPPCCPHLSCAVMPLIVYLFRPPITTCVVRCRGAFPCEVFRLCATTHRLLALHQPIDPTLQGAAAPHLPCDGDGLLVLIPGGRA